MQPHLVLTSEAYQGWIVYAWMRGPEYLYIGSSFNGILRFFGHHIIGKAEAFKHDDKINIFFCQGEFDAISMEQRMILDKQPKYNTISKKPESRRNNGLITQSWKESFKRLKSKGPSSGKI